MKNIVKGAFLVIAIIVTLQIPCYAAEDIYFMPPEKSKEEVILDLFISLLQPHIDKAADDYYSALLTYSPIVYPYHVVIVNAERINGYRSYALLVTVNVTPVVGAHISVGEDRLTFEIHPGRVELKKYEHLKSYELPEHWQHILKE